TVTAGSHSGAVAVNPVTNKVYVTNQGSGNVTVIDGATDSTSTVPAGSGPFGVAVNPMTDKVYVANVGVMGNNGASNTVTVIDGATNSTSTVTAGSSPNAVAVNPVTNKIYVANELSNNVTVIDGATNSTSTVTAGSSPNAVAVNPVTNKIYVANYSSSNVTVIDGTTNTTSTVPAAGNTHDAVAVNPVTNKIYVTNGLSNNVTVISEQQVEDIPLKASITPLAGNQTASATPTFSFTAASTFSPTAPPVESLVYQVDTWQGAWLAAASDGSGGFSGAPPALAPGFHIIYAYSTDGQEATLGASAYGEEMSPLISNITAYGFLAAFPQVTLSTT